MESIILVTVGKVGERFLTVGCQLTEFPKIMIVSALDGLFVGSEVGVVFYQTDGFFLPTAFCRFVVCLFVGIARFCHNMKLILRAFRSLSR